MVQRLNQRGSARETERESGLMVLFMSLTPSKMTGIEKVRVGEEDRKETGKRSKRKT